MWGPRVFCAFVLCGALVGAVSLSDLETIDVWPFPSSIEERGFAAVQLEPSSFAFRLTPSLAAADRALLERAFDRYRPLIFASGPSNGRSVVYKNNIFADKINNTNPTLKEPAATLSGLRVTVASSDVDLQFGVDESYTLSIKPSEDAIELSSETVWGALRGLETLSQLVSWRDGAYVVDHVPLVIRDTPRFRWRGLLVDSSRHFLPMSTMLHILDAMAYNKLNVLHWHVSDAESFPFLSKTFPDLTAKGAYGPEAVYTHEDVARIVSHARDRGIRVLPEFDTPGHTASWGQAYPEILAGCWEFARSLADGRLEWPGWDKLALDVTRNETYDFVRDLYEEIIPLFPDRFFHLGGDEVRPGCWAEIDSMREWMDQNGFSGLVNGTWTYDYAGLQAMWTNLVEDIVKRFGGAEKRSVVWEEAFRNMGSRPLARDTVVNAWEKPPVVWEAVQAGYSVVSSLGWYLDKQAPTCTSDVCPVNWMMVWSWRDMYQYEPLDLLPADATPEQLALIIGGETSSWGESVDAYNFDDRVWTRAPAAAERLWSPRHINKPATAQWRLASFQCKLARRGVYAGPSQPSYCDLLKAPHERVPAVEEASSDKPITNVTIGFMALSGVLLLANLFQCVQGRRKNRDPTAFERLRV